MYSEFSDSSDVYVTMSNNRLECVACCLKGGSFYATSTDQMSIHLSEHVKNGDNVPDYLEDSLWNDDDKNFPY